MSEEQLINLEEKIAHLQHMLDELNMVVFRQGETIEKLNNQIKETNEKLINQSAVSYTHLTLPTICSV